jgi:type VI secretion system protein ImpI
VLEPLPAEPRPAGVAAADGRRLLAAFLEGAGLSPQDVPAADPEAEMRVLGQRFRAMAEGLFQLLALRAEIKRQTGLDRTLIAAQDNNPLKLTANADEATLWLVRPRGAGYLEPKAAIEAAIADLKAFQPELLAAMQAALRQLLRRFDPAALEQELADTPLLTLIAAGGRKAKRWELFKERYAEIARRAESEFLREVGLDLRNSAHDPWRER